MLIIVFDSKGNVRFTVGLGPAPLLFLGTLCEPYNQVLYPFFSEMQRIFGIICFFFEKKAFIFEEDVVS